MWGQLLVLALLATVNPIRLSIILLILSRPRPIQNLFAYWVGAMIVGFVSMLAPLIALHATPASASFIRSFAEPTASPATQRTVIGIGLILLIAAALIAARSLTRTSTESGRHAAPGRVASAGGNASTLVLDSNTPPVLQRLLYPQGDELTENSSSIGRLLSRIRIAWRNGSPKISFVIGVIVLPPLDGILIALALIVASGAAMGIQIGAVIAYVIGVLAVEEVILVSNLVAPAKTQAVLRRVHDFAALHHRKFLAAILALIGISFVLRGMGGL